VSARAFVLPNFSTDEDVRLFGNRLDAWNVLVLQGRAVPGKAELRGGQGAELAVDKKKARGASGATLTMGGREPARATVRLTLWTAAQWGRFCDLCDRTFHATSLRPATSPLSCEFPPLTAIGVDAVLVSRVGPPQPGSVAGTLEVDLELLEFRPMTDDAPKTAKRGAEPSIPSLDPEAENFTSPSGEAVRVAAPTPPSQLFSGPG
jgi:hypothetical protein